jgi:hypothetical protein
MSISALRVIRIGALRVISIGTFRQPSSVLYPTSPQRQIAGAGRAGFAPDRWY